MDGDDASTHLARNVADPNAPFSVPSPKFAIREPLLDVNGVDPCAPAQLSLFESRAQVNGMHHTVRFSIANSGYACRLGGFPSVTLLRADGSVIGGLRIRKVSSDSMSASLGSPIEQTADTLPGETAATAPSPMVLVPSKGEAAFQIGWTSGMHCEQVSRIAIAAPGATQSMQISRPISLCEDQILITAVAPADLR